jgi:hypothetical protein
MVVVYRAVGSVGGPGGGGIGINMALADSAGAWSLEVPPGLGPLDLTAVANHPLAGGSELTPRLQVQLPFVRR